MMDRPDFAGELPAQKDQDLEKMRGYFVLN
jgi:hypothetical protein